MRIAIDIDGVLTDDDDYVLSCTTKYAYENNILESFKRPNVFTYQKYDWDEQIRTDYREKYLWDYYENERPRRFAREIIEKLRSEGNEIIIFTARWGVCDDTEHGEKVKSITLNWLKKNNIYYDYIVYITGDKSQECLDHNIDLIIEDSPKVINAVKDGTKYVVCYDCRYNTDITGENIIRAYSWYDIYHKIRNLT